MMDVLVNLFYNMISDQGHALDNKSLFQSTGRH